MDGYRRGSHSKYSLKIHLIFVTKYRKKLFAIRSMSDDVKQFLYEAAERNHYRILPMETDTDHVHLLLEYGPKDSVSGIVQELKQHSTYRMWKYHQKYLTQQYWKRKDLWSDGYFVCSIGQVSQATIEKYIQSQG